MEAITQITQLSPLLIAGLGLSVGLEHAFEPDHVAAVGTQVSGRLQKSKNQIFRTTSRSSVLGVLWGAGHTTTLVLMGLLAYVLAVKIEPRIFSSLELGVGLMLVFLAITTILNKKPRFGHKHPHQHQDGTLHYDSHDHVDIDHKHNHRSYLIGCVHGLAGSGGLVVLTAATLDNVGMILGFILIFGIGSMIGMALISGLMGVPFALAKNSASMSKISRYVAGFLSLVIGANIICQIAATDGFFGIKIL